MSLFKENLFRMESDGVSRFKPLATFLFRLLISGFLIFLVFRKTNPASLWKSISLIPITAFVTAYLLILGGGIPGALAWQAILKKIGTNVRFIILLKLNYIGFFFNSFLPTGVGGHFWRGYALWKITGKPLESVVSTIAERISAFGSIVLLGLLSLIVNFSCFYLNNLFWPILGMIGIIGLTCFGFVMMMPWLIKKGLGFDSRVSEVDKSLASEKCKSLFFKEWRVFSGAVLLNVLSQLTEAAAYWALFTGMGLSVPGLTLLTLVPILRFVNHLPVSWNSVGTQDLAMVLFWGALGLPPERVLPVSLMMHLLRLLTGGFGGITYLLYPVEPGKP